MQRGSLTIRTIGHLGLFSQCAGGLCCIGQLQDRGLIMLLQNHTGQVIDRSRYLRPIQMVLTACQRQRCGYTLAAIQRHTKKRLRVQIEVINGPATGDHGPGRYIRRPVKSRVHGRSP